MSALMWLLYLYFIREALIELYYVAKDLFDWTFAGAAPPGLPTISRFFDTMQNYGIVILANGAILIAWALYNQARFRGNDRRYAREKVSTDDLARLYNLPAEDIAQWQESRILLMRHDNAGTLVEVKTREPGQD